MNCSDCGMYIDELVTCDVCGRKVCAWCFAETHDGVTLAFDILQSVETPVDAVKISVRLK